VTTTATIKSNRTAADVAPVARSRGVGDWDVRTSARLEVARQWLGSGGCVLVHGPGGARSSARLEAALDVVTGCRAGRLLRCHAQPRESRRRYAALSRLLASVSGADLELVPTARRGVLIAVLARHVQRLSPAAVRIAVLTLVRQLARQRPVLLRIDHVEHIDADSADVLRFVMSRVEDLPVRIAVTEHTPARALPRHRDLCPSPLLVVRICAPD
jgi:hypothetical protein